MTFPSDFLDLFSEYLEYYPYSDEKGYDGVHDGGIKGLRKDAPESAKKAFAEFQKTERRIYGE